VQTLAPNAIAVRPDGDARAASDLGRVGDGRE
jgi:hypothetical protein